MPSENDCFPGMPSSRYIDLTLNTSGASYTAPANGCFAIWTGLAGANYEYAALFAHSGNVGDCYASEGISPQGYQSPATIYVKKGTTVYIRYNGTPIMFRFYYSDGQLSMIKY